jgi:hypothetical protein
MNTKQILLALLLLDFTGLTAYAVFHYGYVGFFEAMLSSTVGITLFVDLVIALGLVTVWMWQDARDRGWTPIPYALLTLALGSVGPLLYLIRRVGADEAPVGSLAQVAR